MPDYVWHLQGLISGALAEISEENNTPELTPSQAHCPYHYVPKALQASSDKSKLSSPSDSPPSSPPSMGISEPGSMVSEDDDDDFPVTPNSKRSGGKHRAIDAFTHQDSESSHTVTSESKKHAKLYQPYRHRRLVSEVRYRDRSEHILRRHSCNQYSDGMSIEFPYI
ncbi:hypothetical protein BD769DRAFT_1382916 [Suillus cothurnatus]|nr:hypothetical protein BD769DRAFT_1382916 [Suillus cothurnatus]